MRFSDIVGLNEIKTHLVSAVRNNHLAHAQLIASHPGGGGLALALALASFINCEKPLADDSCGECAACRNNAKFVHPDLNFVFPTTSTKNIVGSDVISQNFLKEWRTFLAGNTYPSLEDWVNFMPGDNKIFNISREESRQIVKNLSLKSYQGNYKIMLIWLPEMMHHTAANALLKILEEPAEATLFLLVSHEPDLIINTIRSRTQILTIPRFSAAEVTRILVDVDQANENMVAQIAGIVDGDISEARQLLNAVEDDSHKMFRDWMRLCYTGNFTELVKQSEEFSRLKKISQKKLLQYGLSILRETLLSIYQIHDLIRFQGEERAFVENFGKVMKAKLVEQISKELNEAIYHLERNANAKIMYLDLSLTIASLFYQEVET